MKTALGTGEIAQRFILDVPILPERVLSPNVGAHWATKAKAARRLQRAMLPLANVARTQQGWVAPDRARLRVTFRYKRRKLRDADNLLRMFKPAQDILVVAKIIKADDLEHLEILSPIVVVDRNEGMIIEVEALG